MLYAKVNSEGEIVDVDTSQSTEYSLLVAPNEPTVANILANKLAEKNTDTQQILSSSDSEMMRVLEDLVDLLSEKRLIQFTELPLAAQKKLLGRKWVRGAHNGQDDGLMTDSSINKNDDSLI